MSRTPKHARTRTEILDAAWALISERGAEVSVAEIARAAGISRQSVYLHFGSRSGLLIALVRRADERFEIKERLFDSFRTPDPHRRLRAAIEVWLDFLPRIALVARDLIRLRTTDPDAAAAWDDRMADLRAWLSQLLASIERDGALADGWSVQEAADYLWAAMSMQVWSLLVDDCSWTQNRAGTALVRALQAALLTPPALPSSETRPRPA